MPSSTKIPKQIYDTCRIFLFTQCCRHYEYNLPLFVVPKLPESRPPLLKICSSWVSNRIAKKFFMTSKTQRFHLCLVYYNLTLAVFCIKTPKFHLLARFPFILMKRLGYITKNCPNDLWWIWHWFCFVKRRFFIVRHRKSSPRAGWWIFFSF